MNEWYLEDLSNNVRSVLDHKRQEGKYIGSFALYGYRKDPSNKGKLQIDPEAAAMVERIFRIALSGIGAHKIAQILNEEGIPSPTVYKHLHGINYKASVRCPNSELWSSPTIYQMLHNRTYMGDLVQGRHKKPSYKSKKTVWLPKSEWIIVPRPHEGIIDPETFETVQKIMKGRVRSSCSGMIHPLAQKVICGCCDSVMEQTEKKAQRPNEKSRRYVRCRMHQRVPTRCKNKTCTDLNRLNDMVLQRIHSYVQAYFDPQKMELPRQDNPARKREQAMHEELRRLKMKLSVARRQCRNCISIKHLG